MPKVTIPSAPLSGLFAVSKPSGPTSMSVIEDIKQLVGNSRLFVDPRKLENRVGGPNKKRRKDAVKIGQGGTLDPLADGVLVIGVGKGTKRLSDFLDCVKEYRTTALLGCETDSYDCQGSRVRDAPWRHVTKGAVEAILDRFRGEIYQTPPIFSALKMDGKPLYEYARQGIPLPRPIEKRKVTVHSLDIVDWMGSQHNFRWPQKELTPDQKAALKTALEAVEGDLSAQNKTDEQTRQAPTAFVLSMRVSGGTYVRSIVHDLGRALGSAAHVVTLTRSRQGKFTLDPKDGEDRSCVPWDVIEKALKDEGEEGEDGWRAWEREVLDHFERIDTHKQFYERPGSMALSDRFPEADGPSLYTPAKFADAVKVVSFHGFSMTASSTVTRPLTPGIYAPIPTFFHPDSEDLDLIALEKHIIRTASVGVGLVLSGSMGEAIHLSHSERSTLIKVARKVLDDANLRSVPIISGIGAGSTRECTEFANEAAEAGADCVIAICSGYFAGVLAGNRKALRAFWTEISQKSPIPVIVYNYPGAAGGVNLDSDLINELAMECPNLAGVKLTCGDVGKLTRIAAKVSDPTFCSKYPRKNQDAPFLVLGGLTDFLLPSAYVNGHGAITGLANIAPLTLVKLFQLSERSKTDPKLLGEAQKLQGVVAQAEATIAKESIAGTKFLLHKLCGYGGVPRRPLPSIEPAAGEALWQHAHTRALVDMERSLAKAADSQ